MKDKLRDYADRLERGEPWMHKGAKFTKWIKEVVSDMRNDADKLDAEGDGGAVDFSGTSFVCYLIDKCEGSMISEESLHGWIADFLKNPQYSGNTHPARSGVVSDEDVRDAVVEYQIAAGRTGVNTRGLRAALEHFAKGEHYER